MSVNPSYDALLLVSFGGPEGPDDVIPFLENVLRGKNVPRERMLEVAEHYRHFGGVSPINGQNRELLDKVRQDFHQHGLDLPWYWGNRNWHPLLTDTLREMADRGVQRALAFVTSAFSSYSGCRQYREDLARARENVGANAPEIDKIRVFHNHPGFLFAQADRISQALRALPCGTPVRALFTAHSIPQAMAENCHYQRQLLESARRVAQLAGLPDWKLVYQSRSGPPQQPWLEPDVLDEIGHMAHTRSGPRREHLLLIPIGFLSDHMEVLYDLDTEAAQLCHELEIPLTRVPTVGSHPRIITMIRELAVERIEGREPATLGDLPANPDICLSDCCLYQPVRPTRPA